ncbi:MAG: cytochrome c [Gemmatimonadetes bacterium]|nr:cytochrome c [Gemmatimonadota bacterium]
MTEFNLRISSRFGMLASAGLLMLSGQAALAQTGGEQITFAKHVAPILQEKCQVCHQPNSVAPMSLLTYDDALPYAQLMKAKVSARVMPPWHLDRSVGIQKYQNDRGLTDEQIETIVRWVDGGTPFGDESDLPPPREFPDPNRWQLGDRFGEPDMIVKSDPYTLPAETQDKWFRPVVETGLTEPRWVRAIEMKPSYPDGRQIVHHVLTFLEQEEEGLTRLASTATGAQRSAGLFMEWAVGKVGEIFPAEAGKLMLPGAKIRWEVHMHAMGTEMVDNQVELGIWFYPRDYIPRNRTVLRMFDARGQSGLDIRPGEITVTQQFHVLPAPARLENFQPHMHMRGKAMSIEAIYPDGRQEMLSRVNNFQWNWHINYVYEEDVAPLLPKGTTLVITAWHDNTANNPTNPDYRQWVGWGDRTVDEMAHLWVDVTYLEQEEFDRLVAERKAKEETN